MSVDAAAWEALRLSLWVACWATVLAVPLALWVAWVLARRDFGTSYHLSVVLDDADQAITHVIRGRDLYDATWIHVLLHHVIGLPTPIYLHHKLIVDEAGKRLAKRDDARAIAKYRSDGMSPEDVLALVGL